MDGGGHWTEAARDHGLVLMDGLRWPLDSGSAHEKMQGSTDGLMDIDGRRDDTVSKTGPGLSVQTDT